MKKKIEDVPDPEALKSLEIIRAGQNKTLEALESLQRDEAVLEAIAEIRAQQLEIIKEIEIILEEKR